MASDWFAADICGRTRRHCSGQAMWKQRSPQLVVTVTPTTTLDITQSIHSIMENCVRLLLLVPFPQWIRRNAWLQSGISFDKDHQTESVIFYDTFRKWIIVSLPRKQSRPRCIWNKMASSFSQCRGWHDWVFFKLLHLFLPSVSGPWEHAQA